MGKHDALRQRTPTQDTNRGRQYQPGARRNLHGMELAQVELSDAWNVRERYLLVRERASLPPFADALIDALCKHYGKP